MSGYTLAYCVDPAFAMPLSVSLRTVLEHWIGGRTLEVNILESGFSKADRTKVENSLPQNDCYTLNWISVNPAEVDGLATGPHFSSANYFRLLLPQLLPKVDEVLYLDADTLVRGDLAPLFELFDAKLPMQACQDYSGTISNPLLKLPSFAEFGLTADSTYFNTGVLLMNLKLWRDEKISEKVIRLGREKPEILSFADQTAINLVLKGRIGTLPSRWNAQTVHPKVTDGTWKFPYVAQNLESCKIVHYNTEFKPWNLGKSLPQAGLFRAVLSRTAWR